MRVGVRRYMLEHAFVSSATERENVRWDDDTVRWDDDTDEAARSVDGILAWLDNAGGFVQSFIGSLAVVVLVGFIGWLRGWWFRKKKQESIDLARRVLAFLEGDGDVDTKEVVRRTKILGDTLVYAIRDKIAFDPQVVDKANEAIDSVLAGVNPLVSKLAGADKELDRLKRALTEFKEGLERRGRIVDQLSTPQSHLDSGHVRSQLLDVNVLPAELRAAAAGEAALFVRGYGINKWQRYKYFRQIWRENYPKCRQLIWGRYRKILQETALHKAKKGDP